MRRHFRDPDYSAFHEFHLDEGHKINIIIDEAVLKIHLYHRRMRHVRTRSIGAQIRSIMIRAERSLTFFFNRFPLLSETNPVPFNQRSLEARQVWEALRFKLRHNDQGYFGDRSLEEWISLEMIRILLLAKIRF